MSFADAVRACLVLNYATSSGRARRSEYWWFSVLYVAATLLLVGISAAVEEPLLTVLLLPLVVPMLAVSVRRLHDTGKSGRRMLIALIPVADPVVRLVGMAVDSATSANQYGPSPKVSGKTAG
ncbi:DUF805 domain-containing protein [Streptomyces sp. SID13726]|uniref:DUF805 domain-containing protein n=1 Tax=Streptomyces sp. SID13726 TaxID=2706058 RepID=UPI0013B7948B|nr:DUF805 domain-containing protein [Streptomyces sp. SID13726]NEB00421.1 DUF805 domain-containing protein [Streptomyces sp. SID13726]